MDKYNILMICSDQHRADITGCSGNSVIDTPNIDRLARDGMTFDSAYCNSPVCVPSRMSFLTGRFCFHIDALTNGSILDSRIPTVANMLNASGYHTVLDGRMHFQGSDQRHGFTERIMGDFAPYFLAGAKGDRYKTFAPLSEAVPNGNVPDPLLEVGPGNTSVIDFDREVTHRACEWLKTYPTECNTPFFMTVGYFAPHCPYICPPELYRKYDGRVPLFEPGEAELDRLHPYHREFRERSQLAEVPKQNLRKATTAYYGLVDFVDGNVGRILDVLEKRGLLDSTIIVYYSDHGEMLGEHGRWHKSCFYEGSMRVPLIIRQPGANSAGTVVKENVSLVDLAPTLCEWAGYETPPAFDGDSLADAVAGKPLEPNRIIRSEYYNYTGSNRCAVQGNWKLSYYGGFGSYELYNPADDPKELTNRAGTPGTQRVFRRLKDALFEDGWHVELLDRYNRFYHEVGLMDVLKGTRRHIPNDPLITDIPGYWKDIVACENYVRPDD